MKKLLSTILISIALLFVFQAPSYAAVPKPVHYAPETVAYLNWNETEVKMIFVNVKNATHISYTLTYESNSLPQGVDGSVNPDGSLIVSKTVFLGTCSSATCVPHKNIKKLKLQVTYTFPGKTITKTIHVR